MKVAVFLSVLLVPLAVSGCSNKDSDSKTASSDWREFDPEQGRFTVKMPGPPAEIAADQRQVTKIWAAEAGGVRYTVSYLDLPDGRKKLDQDQLESKYNDFEGILPIVENIDITGRKAPINVAGVTGREIDVTTADHKASRIRICLNGGRFYRVDATGTPESVNNNVQVDAFFDSLRIGG